MPRGRVAKTAPVAASPVKTTTETRSRRGRPSTKAAAEPEAKKEEEEVAADNGDSFEDEIEGIQQFIQETEKAKRKDSIDDEFAGDSEENSEDNSSSSEAPDSSKRKSETSNSGAESKPKTESIPFDESKFSSVNLTAASATEGRCGQCEGCKRSACHECSACKRQDFDDCIDLYCTNQKSGLSERAAIREMYIKAMKKQSAEQERLAADKLTSEEDEDDGSAGDTDNTDGDGDDNGPSKTKKSRGMGGVYGGSTRAAKLRRCGECEGCTRDDCGQCVACIDKPRFGGKGSKKKACIERYCRLKAGRNF